jgi:hypothetical protein
VSVLLIEHDMDLVFSFARRMTVLVNGAVLTEGTPEAIASDPRVKAVYLGRRIAWLNCCGWRAERRLRRGGGAARGLAEPRGGSDPGPAGAQRHGQDHLR